MASSPARYERSFTTRSSIPPVPRAPQPGCSVAPSRLGAGVLVLGSVVTAGALAAMAVRGARRWFLLVAASVAGVAIWVSEVRIAAGAVAVGVIANDLIRTTTARRRVSNLVRRCARTSISNRRCGRHSATPPSRSGTGLMARAVSRHGRAVPLLAATTGRSQTELRMGDTLVAEIHHDPACAEVPALAGALDGPARIALENERLAAQLASQGRELQRSRARIVDRGDRERRQLERDVHDSAQQHVLALGFDVRTALAQRPEDNRRGRCSNAASLRQPERSTTSASSHTVCTRHHCKPAALCPH